MPVETNTKQNTIIWSACGGIILVLCGVVGWLINGKDSQLTSSINNLIVTQKEFVARAEESDRKIMDAFNKLCERVGGIEGRVGNLEIYIQMPFGEREKYIFKPKNGNKP